MKTVTRVLRSQFKRRQRPRWMRAGPRKWAQITFGSVALGDRRRNARLIEVAAALAARPTDSIPQATENGSEAKSAYRFVENAHVSDQPLIRAEAQSTAQLARGEAVVLAVQDTTGLTFPKAHVTEGLGRMASGEKTTVGMFLHSTLALRADGVAIGPLHLHAWCRTEPAPTKDSRAERERSIQEKENFCWIQGIRAAHRAVEALPEAERPRLVHMGDRGEDFYDALLEVVRLRDSAVIRCSQNRGVLTEDGQSTYAHQAVRAAPLLARRSLEVPRDGGRPGRKAIVELRAVRLRVPPPQGWRGPGEVLRVHLVEVFEPKAPSTVKEPLHWLLWTFEPIATLADVVHVTDCYRFRWRIEDYHLILKVGCRVQSAQFETLQRLLTIIALYAPIAVRLLRLRDLARTEPLCPCTVFLSDLEWRTLLIATEKGKAARERPPPTLSQAARLLARLGGHLNRKSDGPPGVTTLWRGYRDLMLLTQLHDRLLHS